jgi:hypothetical protein
MSLLYTNSLANEKNLEDFILEGQAQLNCTGKSLVMQNTLSPALGQKANYVLWCPETFPPNIRITWEFRPLSEEGLSMIFFGAKGMEGQELFDNGLQTRSGIYNQYHHGDINTFHLSYYRRKEADEKAFHTCNLRKSYGFHLVAQGADPLPNAYHNMKFYKLALDYKPDYISFSINGLKLLEFFDDGETFGPQLQDGKLGFRQLAPLIGEYRNLKVFKL